ncbi:conserved hypothetical protein [Nostocoides japonicum T1-X7]|uniref:Uncharacterized protein n=1 Tax=Nostocoides japonicum T1-X7 TaxID=1194083 RepID=A0A077M002_9MICO|nr:hypothetical protein [Tetrasphaera japonica]CCH79588.1 conserved hypothetical protein [Tetrasphaera japonica T1-X7]
MSLRTAADVDTAPLTVLGLAGGFLVADQTGVRPAGGALFAAVGAYCARSWARQGLPTALGLGTVYAAAMGLSHPLAKRIGAWPAVAVVSAATATAAHLLSDRKS